MHTPSLCIFEITLAGKIPGMHYYQHINILRTFLLRPNISWHWKLVLMKFFDCTRNVFMFDCNGIPVLRYYIYLFITFLWGSSVSDKYMLAKLSAFLNVNKFNQTFLQQIDYDRYLFSCGILFMRFFHYSLEFLMEMEVLLFE